MAYGSERGGELPPAHGAEQQRRRHDDPGAEEDFRLPTAAAWVPGEDGEGTKGYRFRV